MNRYKQETSFAKVLRVYLLASLIFALTVGSMQVVFADDINPGVFAIDSRPFGLTYGQWSEKWWQWAFQNTTFDTKSSSFNGCPNESGPVWFLIAPAVTNCVIAANTAILFPTFNVEWSVEEANAQRIQSGTEGTCFVPTIPNGTGYAALLACARAQANNATQSGATLEAAVDGRPLQSLRIYRAHSTPPPFAFTAISGNIFVPPGPSQAVADGFWIMLEPLHPGKHSVHFAAKVPFPTVNPPATPFTFTTVANYCLVVQPSLQTCP